MGNLMPTVGTNFNPVIGARLATALAPHSAQAGRINKTASMVRLRPQARTQR